MFEKRAESEVDGRGEATGCGLIYVLRRSAIVCTVTQEHVAQKIAVGILPGIHVCEEVSSEVHGRVNMMHGERLLQPCRPRASMPAVRSQPGSCRSRRRCMCCA
jgi:hypothetical protein